MARLYSVKDSQDYFRTGVSSRDGGQALCGRQADRAVCLRFSADGRFLGAESKSLSDPADDGAASEEIGGWMQQLGFTPATIHVREFTLAERSIAVKELPDYLQQFVDGPSRFPKDRQEHLSRRVDEWQRAGSFVLIWDEEYEMSADGDVEST